MRWEEFDSEIDRSFDPFRERLYVPLRCQHGIQKSDADDIIQQAMRELVKKRAYERFQPQHVNSFWGWIKAYVSVSRKKWLRRQKWRRKYLCSLIESFDDDEPSDNEILLPRAYLETWTPCREIESARVVAAIRKATAVIPAWQMDVFERHYVHGESVRGLAREVGMREKALASLLRRVRIKLKGMLASHNPRAPVQPSPRGNPKN